MLQTTKFRNNNKRRIVSDINITPFVDILLVLLIIFMVTAPIITSSVDVNLPKGSESNITSKKDQPIPVSIKSNGSIFLGEEAVKLTSISSQLLKITGNNLNSKIYIRADEGLDYGRVMEVVKTIGISGFTQVSLATELTQ